MKKIIYSILVAAVAFASCTKITDESYKDVPFDKTKAPELKLEAASDSSVIFTVKPADENTAYFSYLFCETGAAGIVDPDYLLQGAYIDESAGFFGKVMSGASEGDMATVEYLQPGASYTLYAVAASKTGVVSEISTAKVVLADAHKTVVTGCDYETVDDKMTIYVEFDRDIEITEVSEVTASYWGINDMCDPDGYIESALMVENVSAENLSVEGNVLCVNVPKYVPGAYVSITFSEGVVFSATGNPNEAYDTEIFSNEGPVKGIFGQYENVNFDVKLVLEEDGKFIEAPEDTCVSFADAETFAAYFMMDDMPATVSDEKEFRMIAATSDGRTVSTIISYCEPVAVNPTVIAATLPEVPVPGSLLSYSIPEGYFQDVYGNENNDFEAKDNFLYSYGFTAEDFIGTYSFSYTTYFGITNLTEDVVVAPGEEDGEFKVYNLFKTCPSLGDLDAFTPANPVFTLYVNYDSGEMILSPEVIGQGSLEEAKWKGDVFLFGENGDDSSNLYSNMAGFINLTDALYFYCGEVLGTWDMISAGDFSLERTSTKYEVPAAPAAIAEKIAPVKFDKKVVKH